MATDNDFEDWALMYTMNQIDGVLYLGGIASTKKVDDLRRANITTILSVISDKIPREDRISGITYYWVQADDAEDEDLLTWFPDMYAIIDRCVVSDTGILVHCAAGISRSSTTVCSYLMKKRQNTYEQIVQFVRSRRPIIDPNLGFVAQLELWQEMGYRLDANSHRFRQYTREIYFQRFPFKMKKYFSRLRAAENMTQPLNLGQQYVCKKCGERLFHELHVLKRSGGAIKGTCGYVFIDPQPWMSELNGSQTILDRSPDQPIRCQKCRQQVAKCWTTPSAYQCPCIDHSEFKQIRVQMLDNTFSLKSK
jgi:dual specificity phosphatase 12